MGMEWNLDKLYTSLDSKEYKRDKDRLVELINKTNEIAATLDKKNAIECLTNYLKNEEEMECLLQKMFSFSNLKSSTNVNDTRVQAELASLSIMLQDTVVASVQFKRFLMEIELKDVVVDPFLKQYQFLLECQKESASHMLSEKEEILYAKLRMVASDGWSEIQSKLTSNLMITVPGFDEPMPLSMVRGLAYDKDPVVRKNAYIAEINAYKGVEDAVAMALNNIKREANMMADMRGYKNILDMTLIDSNTSKETLDAMIAAIQEELPEFRKYFKLKAKALGYTNGLPFYELFAPMGGASRKYTFDEAKEQVLDVYKSFSDKLYQLGYRAFTEDWIDVLPHEGKVGGAFDNGIQSIGESRIMTNFTGELGDVQTLAHELGHAYHDSVTVDNAPLNWDYPMPLAETASILCQTLMSKKMISDAKTKEEKLTIIENSLQEDTQCVVDILSRYLFENMVCDTPIEQPLSAEDMCEFMLKAQDESYGDGLDPEYKHKYMWLCKGHYYSAGYNFYNWPYAFGLLYAKGLYSKYLENKELFVKKYDEMLRNTCLMKAEEVASCMGIDITKKEFWISSLKTIEEDIQEFEELINE